jgi:ElaB/YqjD/DUF883 family membrane-anchored ribosome-binding protein
MDDEPEVIRQQMETTRSDLTDKIEALEHQVVGTVQNTTQAVSDTVESVKDAVQETVSAVKDTVTDTVGTVKESVAGTVMSVKEALDLRGYVEQYPWASFGAAVAAGFAGGLLLEGSHRARGRIAELHSHGEAANDRGRSESNGSQQRPAYFAPTARSVPPPAEAVPDQPSWLHQLTQRFAPEIDKLKGMAVGALGALVRDMASQAAAGQLGDQLSHMIDDVTRKLGGEPIRGPLLQKSDTADGKSNRDRETANEARPAVAQAW